MSIVDVVMRIVTAGLIIAAIIQAFTILFYLHRLCEKMFALGMELLATMKAQGQPPAPDTEEEVLTEDELVQDAIVQKGTGFHGRHHCSEGEKS